MRGSIPPDGWQCPASAQATITRVGLGVAKSCPLQLYDCPKKQTRCRDYWVRARLMSTRVRHVRRLLGIAVLCPLTPPPHRAMNASDVVSLSCSLVLQANGSTPQAQSSAGLAVPCARCYRLSQTQALFSSCRRPPPSLP